MEPTLERLQGAMKFSLLMWALYWPLGGLVLLVAGMKDPASLAVVAACLATLAFLVASGAVRSQGLRTAGRFVADRPIYVLAAVVGVILLGTVLDFLANIGLAVFAACYLASLALVVLRLRDHLRATGQGVIQSRADQLFLLMGISILLALPLFGDMVLQALGGGAIGSPGPAVAVTNLVSIAYPPLLMLAARPFRAPLKSPFARPVAPAAQFAPAARPGAAGPRPEPVNVLGE